MNFQNIIKNAFLIMHVDDIARRFRADPGTVRGWKRGHLPSVEHAKLATQLQNEVADKYARLAKPTSDQIDFIFETLKDLDESLSQQDSASRTIRRHLTQMMIQK